MKKCRKCGEPFLGVLSNDICAKCRKKEREESESIASGPTIGLDDLEEDSEEEMERD